VSDESLQERYAPFDVRRQPYEETVFRNIYLSFEAMRGHLVGPERNGDMTFTDVASSSGLVHTHQGRGIAALDADNDGAMDIVIFAFDGPLRYYRNNILNQAGTNWLRVFLDAGANPGIPPNGYGAIVRAVVGEQTFTRAITGGSHYLSQSELSAHFGLRDAPMVDELRIEWPNGLVTTINDVHVNQSITITAPAPTDLNGDGVVDGADLGLLLGAWGQEGPTLADLNGDGVVDGADLGTLLGGWG